MSTRDAYVEKLKAKLDEWKAALERFEAKANGAEADAKIEYDEQIRELKGQREEAERQLRELEHAREDAWRDMRNGLESAWKRIETAFSDAKGRFK